MTRDLNLDILRVVSIAAVVMIHVVAPYEMTNTFKIDQFQSWIVIMLNDSLFWCVPVLFMVSGALLLSNRDESMQTFYKKRMNKVLLPTLFWSSLYLAYLYIYKDFSLFNVVGALLKGKPFYHMWFMFAIIGLYIFTPFFRILLDNLDDKQTKWLLVLLFVFSIGHNYLAHYLDNTGTIFSSFLTYLGYFILGDWLYRQKSKFVKHSRLALISFVFGVVLTVIIYIVLKYEMRIDLPLLAYYSPFIALQSVTLYVFLLSRKPVIPTPGILVQLSWFSFGVYLIHPLYIILIQPFMVMDKLIMLPLFYVFVLGSSYTSVYLLSRIKYTKAII